jgi:HAD superfamily hydrolase (TIGR01549 family)
MIKAVLFDFGQTLVDSADGFRQAEKEAQAAIFRDLAITDRDAFMRHYRSIRAEFHQESKLSRFEIWRAVYRSLRCEPSAERLRHWEQAYWRTVQEHTRVFAEAPGVLGDLVARNKPIGLVTNTQGQVDAGAHRIAAFPELAAFFQVTVVAGENGVPPKPDGRAFAACLEQLGVAAADAVYVGDDWRIDIRGARDVGLHPVWLKHHRVMRTYPEVDTDVPVITSLTDLIPLLDVL